jgi:hypothetical protein
MVRIFVIRLSRHLSNVNWFPSLIVVRMDITATGDGRRRALLSLKVIKLKRHPGRSVTVYVLMATRATRTVPFSPSGPDPSQPDKLYTGIRVSD